ncbi:MAG: hypothetical protein PHT84_01580 [Candidatus Pacebacteria bacterium]|nr:hypothetical protein [Candidatus Paceibacterota bacterium]
MKIITQGLSRLVFIYGDYAIKIPWINFVLLIKCFLKYKNEGIFEKKASRYGNNKIMAIPCYIGHILSSNRREYLYFKKHQNEEALLPVIKTFLFGFIIIQPKGNVFTSSNPRWLKFLKKNTSRGITDVDLTKPENFCEFNGLVRLLDYGNDQTQEILDCHGFGVIKE